ncbi:MAG TPA: hypothetical protein DCK87_00325 [Desulfotomaculum sp.]|nr:hypothetical protein [Desulfotomaculum sp.]
MNLELVDGDQANGLCFLLNMLLTQNLNNADKQQLAQKMKCSIGINGVDTDQKATLIFNNNLVIKNGFAEPLKLVIKATTDQILDVSQVKVIGGVLPVGFFTKRGWGIIKEILKGKLVIKGLLTHPVTAIRFIAIVSVA